MQLRKSGQDVSAVEQTPIHFSIAEKRANEAMPAVAITLRRSVVEWIHHSLQMGVRSSHVVFAPRSDEQHTSLFKLDDAGVRGSFRIEVGVDGSSRAPEGAVRGVDGVVDTSVDYQRTNFSIIHYPLSAVLGTLRG